MWSEINRYLPRFKSAVLTGLDTGGRPFSLRCRPRPNGAGGLRLDLNGELPFEPGAACLLFHSHDERLWNLFSFLLRGTLETDPQGWVFHPEQFIPGMGIGGLMSFIRFLRQGRHTTRHYLAKRGLPRPRVPWGEWQSVFDQIKDEVI